MNNGRRLTKKQTVRLMVGLTILAWATQTLLKQWGLGAEVPTTAEAEQLAQPVEKFVPGKRYLAGASLEMRSEATVIGAEVKLRQVCRWSDSDRAMFDPIGDLVLDHLGTQAPFKAISVEELRGTLRDAGVNVAMINFSGAISCTVARSDVQYDEKNALQEWIDAKQNAQSPTADASNQPQENPTTKAALAAAPTTSKSDENPIKTLRESLIADLAERLNLPADTLQVDFKAQDEKVLNLSSPLFHYQIDPVRVKTLGPVEWNVSIISNDGGSKKVSINADVRAWQNQVVASKPMAYGQVIREQDITQRRTLVDQSSDDPLVTKEQIVGEQAAREIKPGMVLTGKMIDPVQLVKTGQFVTITLEQGTVKIKTVARAMEGGAYGQTIRVKNEATKDIYQVVITGPQQATMNLTSPVASAAGPPD
ncbi:MAG TPA: flagellar basal body P-ring formation chaperone FlgA [Tepidisphaeraceae bacterium]|nr:flagellar basal body P-ring formation chaperone FlgA [Tepidisphaeraceae bacterium]